MEQPKEGGETKPAEAPAQAPVKTKPEVPQPNSEAGKDENEDKKVVEALENSNKALERAEHRIVELKRENDLLKKGGGEGDPELAEKVAKLETEIEALKQERVPKQEVDERDEELAKARKVNSELAAVIISKQTAGKGEGAGNNQDVIQPKMPEEYFAKTPQEIAILERRGIDPKTGKKKSS